MNPLDYIERLQRKPESTRKKILIVVVSTVSIIIIAVWLATFSINTP